LRIAPNVYRQLVEKPGPDAGGKYNNVYLISAGRAAFFDSGYHDREHLELLLELWKKTGSAELAGVIVSHWHRDHSGGIKALSDKTGCSIFSSPTEKAVIEQESPGTFVDMAVSDGETLDLNGATLEFIHLPGHTYGSMGVLYQEEGILFAGDVIRTSEPFHMNGDHGSFQDHLRSLAKLLTYDIRLICPGHGPLVHEPQTFLEKELEMLEKQPDIGV
jgi:glyoxylase-like metal-dependent hydrolase (beta-lactamase superfamily II)